MTSEQYSSQSQPVKIAKTYCQEKSSRTFTFLSHVRTNFESVQLPTQFTTVNFLDSVLYPPQLKIMKILSIGLLFTFMTFESQISFANTGASNWLSHVTVDQTLHVNNRHPNANDENSGLERTSPLLTIAKAMRLAVVSRHQGVSTEVLIYPGTYRETIEVGLAQRKGGPPIIMRARQDNPGKTIISGSDIWDNWKRTPNNIYTHSWPYAWGLQPVLATWHAAVPINPIIQRKEMILVNGERLEQVLALSELRPNTFYISEKTKTVFVSPPLGTIIDKSIIEVATRSQLVQLYRMENFVIQGLQFQHAASAIGQKGAVHISGSKNILIEDNRFVLNNWTGLGFARIQNVTTRRNVMHRNGGTGWKGIWVKSLLSENDTSSFNNWRGKQGNFLRWDAAGIKHLHIHDATYNHVIATNNLTRGLWLDADNIDIVINRACLCENLTDGLKIEASPGPIRIENSRICSNQGYGLLVNTGRRIMLRNNVLANNENYPIHITGAKVRTIVNWESGEKVDVRTEDWTMIGNVMFGATQALFSLPHWEHFFETLYSNDNIWHARNTDKVFGLGREGNLSHLSLSEWQQQMQIDVDSHSILPLNLNQPTCQ